jgi:hypothetical protein
MGAAGWYKLLGQHRAAGAETTMRQLRERRAPGGTTTAPKGLGDLVDAITQLYATT